VTPICLPSVKLLSADDPTDAQAPKLLENRSKCSRFLGRSSSADLPVIFFLLFSAFSVPHPRSMSTVGVFGRRTAESRRLFLSCSVEFYDLMSRKTISRYSTSLLLSHSLSKVNSARSHGAEGKGKRRQIAI
jgi:hypothetical protein